ncbi:hypothetical protein WJX74_010526 [Apatococcus lobatus]|uniref:Uncharacterized protein n=1 Tax=Apatococcus lobatus TaxID=904363 RepID=A0AAW1Q9L7_9CHLO
MPVDLKRVVEHVRHRRRSKARSDYNSQISRKAFATKAVKMNATFKGPDNFEHHLHASLGSTLAALVEQASRLFEQQKGLAVGNPHVWLHGGNLGEAIVPASEWNCTVGDFAGFSTELEIVLAPYAYA